MCWRTATGYRPPTSRIVPPGRNRHAMFEGVLGEPTRMLYKEDSDDNREDNRRAMSRSFFDIDTSGLRRKLGMAETAIERGTRRGLTEVAFGAMRYTKKQMPTVLASDAIDAMTKLRLAARWAEAKGRA